jgi:hypothetical protein
VSERLGQGAGLGISFAGAGAVALAAMQVLQEVVGAFDPRPEVQGLIALTVALAGLTLERTRYVLTRRAHEREREEGLAGWLGAWPPGTVSELDPVALGLFPPRADLELGEGWLPPYVPRDVDDAVRGALCERGLVLIMGPARSGKSRTAYEAVRAVAGDRHLLAPEDRRALSEMLRADEPDRRPDDVLWLDDLDRFLPSLGGPELRALSSGRYHVIATIRERPHDELAEAGGERGQRERGLLTHARIIHLGAALNPEEAEHAAEVYPGEDLSAGIGAALSARWDDQHTLSERGSAPIAPEPARTGLWAGPDLVLAAALALTVTSAAALTLLIGVKGFSPPSIGDQLDGIREAAAEAGDEVIRHRRLELHGFETGSHLVVVRSLPEADELRIYDEDGGELERMLSFRPTAPQFRYGNFELLAVRDLDHDGDRELVGDYLIQFPPLTFVRVPFAVTWDQVARNYVPSALLTERSALARRYRGRRLLAEPSFRTRYTLADPAAGRPLDGFGVSTVVFDRDSGLLASAVEEYGRDPFSRGHLAVNLYRLHFGGALPELRRFCDPHTSTSVYVHPVSINVASFESELRRILPVAARRLSGLEVPSGCRHPRSDGPDGVESRDDSALR